MLLLIGFKSSLVLELELRPDSKLRLALEVVLELERMFNKLWLELIELQIELILKEPSDLLALSLDFKSFLVFLIESRSKILKKKALRLTLRVGRAVWDESPSINSLEYIVSQLNKG